MQVRQRQHDLCSVQPRLRAHAFSVTSADAVLLCGALSAEESQDERRQRKAWRAISPEPILHMGQNSEKHEQSRG